MVHLPIQTVWPRKFNNRLYGRIGYAEMNKIKMFQIDSFDDIVLAENLIKQLNIN